MWNYTSTSWCAFTQCAGTTVNFTFTLTHTYVEQDYIHKVPVIWMTTFSTILTNLTVLLLQSGDCSRYVSRPVLAPPPLKHTDLRAYEFAQSPDL